MMNTRLHALKLAAALGAATAASAPHHSWGAEQLSAPISAPTPSHTLPAAKNFAMPSCVPNPRGSSKPGATAAVALRIPGALAINETLPFNNPPARSKLGAITDIFVSQPMPDGDATFFTFASLTDNGSICDRGALMCATDNRRTPLAVSFQLRDGEPDSSNTWRPLQPPAPPLDIAPTYAPLENLGMTSEQLAFRLRNKATLPRAEVDALQMALKRSMGLPDGVKLTLSNDPEATGFLETILKGQTAGCVTVPDVAAPLPFLIDAAKIEATIPGGRFTPSNIVSQAQRAYGELASAYDEWARSNPGQKKVFLGFGVDSSRWLVTEDETGFRLFKLNNVGEFEEINVKTAHTFSGTAVRFLDSKREQLHYCNPDSGLFISANR